MNINHESRFSVHLGTVCLITLLLLSACVQPATSLNVEPRASATAAVALTNDRTALLLSPLGRLAMPGQYVSQTLLDNTHVYWLTDQNRATLFRYPLAGGKIEPVVSSDYQDGDLGTVSPVRTGDWLIYVDTGRKSYTSWKVQAFNVKTKLKKTIDSEDNERYLPPVVTAHGDWITISRLRWPNSACTISALEAYHLVDGRTVVVDEVCAEGNYYWHYGAVFGQTIVAERNLPDVKGGGTEIVQFDLSTGVSKTLSTDLASSGPAISERYIVWRAATRFSKGQRVAVVDRQTGERRDILMPGEFASIQLSDHWLYWEPTISGLPMRVFDLRADRVITVTQTYGDQAIRYPSIHRNNIVWVRIENWSQPQGRNSIIEWASLS